MTRENKLQAIMDKWGVEAQMDMLSEECLELALAIRHFRRGKLQISDVIEEIADVGVMLDQMLLIFNPEDIDSIKDRKINRAYNRAMGDDFNGENTK